VSRKVDTDGNSSGSARRAVRRHRLVRGTAGRCGDFAQAPQKSAARNSQETTTSGSIPARPLESRPRHWSLR
jgi:hypothetical protein